MPVSNVMKYVLTSGHHGYYSRKEPIFGASGDFITAPEISQLFGEMVGCWLCSRMKPDQKYTLIELGPGKGTLMKDVLLTLQSLNMSKSVDSVEMLECSEPLRQIQSSAIAPLSADFKHVEDLLAASYAGKNILFLAHEFFDALPVHLFKRSSNRKWAEVLVDYDGKFKFVSSKGSTVAANFLRVDEMFPDEFETLELSPECWSYADKISKLGRHARTLSGIIVDYGNWGPSSGSLRAIWRHKLLESPLENLGEADLSVDVDFKSLFYYLKRSFRCHFMTQREFLESCHIDQRIERLSKSTDIEAFRSQRDRLLIDMGSAYKVMSFEKPD